MPLLALHATISGSVQGVGFRAWTVRRASELGLAGWVKNLPDGRVETFAQGEAENISKFRELLRQGPNHAVVSAVEESPAEPSSEYSEFSIDRDRW